MKKIMIVLVLIVLITGCSHYNKVSENYCVDECMLQKGCEYTNTDEWKNCFNQSLEEAKSECDNECRKYSLD